jgi:hypothetical protein
MSGAVSASETRTPGRGGTPVLGSRATMQDTTQALVVGTAVPKPSTFNLQVLFRKKKEPLFHPFFLAKGGQINK